MRRGELATAAGCHAETIRVYERAGLLPPPPRTASGYRDYGKRDLRRLEFILAGRDLGFGLEDIRALLDLVDGADVTCERVREMAVAHRARIETRIERYEQLLDGLTRVIAACRGGDSPDCPIIEALFDRNRDGGRPSDGNRLPRATDGAISRSSRRRRPRGPGR